MVTYLLLNTEDLQADAEAWEAAFLALARDKLGPMAQAHGMTLASRGWGGIDMHVLMGGWSRAEGRHHTFACTAVVILCSDRRLDT